MSIIGVTVNASDKAPVCITRTMDETDRDWEVLLNHVKDGTYKAAYEVGENIPISVGKFGEFKAWIVAMDEDQINGSDRKAAFTFLLGGLLPERMKMNPSWSKEDPEDDSLFLPGTGAIDGWMACSLRKWLQEEVLPEFPQIVRDGIVPVVKTSRTFTAKSQVFDVMTADEIWIPSRREVFGPGRFTELSGPVYSEVFDDDESRVMFDKDGDPSWWWLRSANSSSTFHGVAGDGSNDYTNAFTEGGVVVGFSIGSGI